MKMKRGLAGIRQGIMLGRIAANIYDADSAERYSWSLRGKMREAYLHSYWSSRHRKTMTNIQDLIDRLDRYDA